MQTLYVRKCSILSPTNFKRRRFSSYLVRKSKCKNFLSLTFFIFFSASKKLFVKTRNLFFAADATMMNQIKPHRAVMMRCAISSAIE